MSEYLSRHTSLKRANKPFHLSTLFKGKKREESWSSLGSGITQPLGGSVLSRSDTCLLHTSSVKQRRRRTMDSPATYSSSSYQRTSMWVSSRNNTYTPSQSTPPLSPTESFASRPVRHSTYESSDSSSDDDDDEPLAHLYAALNSNLLSDEEEDNEPLACLNGTPILSPAEKYKAKVKAKFHFGLNL